MYNKKNKPYKNSFAGKGVFPSKYAFTLLIPIRKIFLSPRTLIKRLGLKEDQKVLEIGPGPGYFSTHVAQKVSKGKLVLLYIQKDMLDRAKKRINKRKIKNVEYRLANGRTLEFDNNYFDVIFMVTVFGEVENKSQYLAEIHRTLKKGGILSISEQAGDPDKMDIDEIRQLVCQFNFSLENIYGKNWNYTANFSKN